MLVRIKQYKDLSDLSSHAAEDICALARNSVKRDGIFTLMLSGGTTPRTLYEYLTRSPYREKMPWNRTHLFWGDERCVSPYHPESNYFMVYQTLISKISIPQENIHPIQADMESPRKTADLYERELRCFFHSGGVEYNSIPSFHLILLGVGTDGHTVSLFPGDDAMEEKNRWVVAVRAPREISPVSRITVTVPIINNGERIFFLASGPEKKEIVHTIIRGSHGIEKLPAARVQAQKEVRWYLDFGY